jgi:ABC-type phosphate transport system ATPase subunit
LAFAQRLGARLGLTDGLLDGQVLRLSSGERQRLALIRALALDPCVLLLDEPTGALDAESTALVEAELRARLAQGTSILLVTHSPEQAARLASRQFHMAHRHLTADA